MSLSIALTRRGRRVTRSACTRTVAITTGTGTTTGGAGCGDDTD